MTRRYKKTKGKTWKAQINLIRPHRCWFREATGILNWSRRTHWDEGPTHWTTREILIHKCVHGTQEEPVWTRIAPCKVLQGALFLHSHSKVWRIKELHFNPSFTANVTSHPVFKISPEGGFLSGAQNRCWWWIWRSLFSTLKTDGRTWARFNTPKKRAKLPFDGWFQAFELNKQQL